eukprot:CAMPEP_0119045090 /NCGR_PEP_ID=MMETSP1177-20130426/36911_1 /TAXON_ID=2985 /ORGANISM="Ochromonas sp, Strain CCMP1899" /LENGTH=261 /DNA_ID=CAMNT_0007016237 /DNA_START=1226 /DNA_END=2008 /DNA_ORIENTATION=+
MLGFGALKVLEYSIMTSATEMIYMPMNHQERYLGKELIRFFGHRMGKSVAVMILSAASAHFNPSMATQSLWGGLITALWSGTMFCLSRHLALRNESDAIISIISDDALIEKNVEKNDFNKIPISDIIPEKKISRVDGYRKVSIDVPSNDTDITEDLNNDSCDSMHSCYNEGEKDFNEINKLENVENINIENLENVENIREFDEEYSGIIDLPSYSSEENEEENFMSLEVEDGVINDEQGLRHRFNKNDYKPDQMASEDLAW